MSIRQDERQALIYQEEPVTGVVGAVEILCTALGAMILQGHHDQAVRAIGHFGESMSKTRLAHWAGQLKGLEPTEMQKELAQHLAAISAYVGNQDTERPGEALDDIQMALIWLDKRARDAGVSGPGWYREIVRESTLGR